MNEVAEKIKNIMAKHVEVKGATPDTPLADLDIDSLDLVEAMMEVEEEFNIEFTNEEILNLKCFNDIVNLVNAKK